MLHEVNATARVMSFERYLPINPTERYVRIHTIRILGRMNMYMYACIIIGNCNTIMFITGSVENRMFFGAILSNSSFRKLVGLRFLATKA